MRRLLLLLIAAVSGLVSGCATLDTSQSQGFEVRGEYVGAVERVAEKRGVTVIWINPPTRQRTRQIEYVTEVTVERAP